MFRPASRVLLRAPVGAVRAPASRRLISTTSTETKSRSLKSTVLRFGLAAGAIYYYNTSSVFTENPSLSFRSQNQPPREDDTPLPTLDSIKPKIRETRAQSTPKSSNDQVQEQQTAIPTPAEGALKSPQELEEEAGQEAAFNPETGEINWDCPCLGGMAHGPCGEEFKAAFSCFVYSEEEPKGIDCIEKFKGMQDCFRQYPEVYGAELEDDEEAAAATNAAIEAGESPAEQPVAAPEVEVVIPETSPKDTPVSEATEGQTKPETAQN